MSKDQFSPYCDSILKALIIGDPKTFAIESCISQAYERLSLRALGFFIIHLGGFQYGVRSPDATMLACSFDEVNRRIVRRGTHTALFSNERNAAEIALGVNNAIYAADKENEMMCGLSMADTREAVRSKHLLWAPDGDEAFDDSSRVLQFDFVNHVRLIGYKAISPKDGFPYDRKSLVDQQIEADMFYQTLQRWSEAFEAEWKSAPKAS